MRLLLAAIATAHLAIDLTSSWTSPSTLLLQHGKVSKDLLPAACTSPIYETDYRRWREFQVNSAQETMIELTAEAGALEVTLEKAVLRLEQEVPAQFTLTYHCNDFNEGVHRVQITITARGNSTSFAYFKVCGRPNTSWDLSQLFQPLFRILLSVLITFWATLNPSPYRFHLWSRKTVLFLLICIGLALLVAAVEALHLVTGLVLALIAVWKGLEVGWKLLPVRVQTERVLNCGLLGGYSYVSVGSAVVATAVALAYAFSQNWLIGDFITCSFLFFLLIHITIDCGKCCFSLFMLTFLYDVCDLFYVSLPNDGELSEWLGQKCEWPLVLKLPRMHQSVLQPPCLLTGFMDLLYPCLVLDFARRLDARHTQPHYYKPLLIAYSLSLLAHSLLPLLTPSPQPESLFISPILLLTAAVVAIANGDLLSVWRQCE
jgi:hypothetical protein